MASLPARTFVDARLRCEHKHVVEPHCPHPWSQLSEMAVARETVSDHSVQPSPWQCSAPWVARGAQAVCCGARRRSGLRPVLRMMWICGFMLWKKPCVHGEFRPHLCLNLQRLHQMPQDRHIHRVNFGLPPHIACVRAQCRGLPICGAQASKPSVESAIRDAVIGTKFSRTPRLTEMIRLLAGAIMIRSGTPGEVHLVVLLHSSRGISRSC